MPTYSKRNVDDRLTINIVPKKASADNFLEILNQCHLSIKFTMETESSNKLPFLGTLLTNKQTHFENVYVKPTNTGILLHHEPCRCLMQTQVIKKLSWHAHFHFHSIGVTSIARYNCFLDLNTLPNLSILLFHSLLQPKHWTNLLPYRLLTINQIAFVLFFHL